MSAIPECGSCGGSGKLSMPANLYERVTRITTRYRCPACAGTGRNLKALCGLVESMCDSMGLKVKVRPRED